MVELVLVLGQPTSPPIKLISARTGVMIFWLPQRHCTASPLLLSWSRYYTIGHYIDSSFIGVTCDGRRVVGRSTTQCSSQRFYCGIDGSDFVL